MNWPLNRGELTVNIDQKYLLKTLNEAIKYKGTPGTARDGQN